MIMQNFVNFSQVVLEMSQFLDGRPPSCNFKFLVSSRVRRANVHHHTMINAFQNGIGPPSWICGGTFLDHLRRVLGGLCHYAEFGWNCFSNVDNTNVWIFYVFGLKMPIHGAKMGENGNFLHIYPSKKIYNNPELTSYKWSHVEIVSVV